MREYYRCLWQALKQGRGGKTAIIVASDLPGHLNQRVYCDAEGRRVWPVRQSEPTDKLLEWLRGQQVGAPSLEEVTGLGTIYAEPVETPPEVLILGAGYVGQALARVMSVLRYPTTVVDDRPEFASQERLPSCRVICGEFEKVLADYPVGPRTFVVIVTRGHRSDYACLRALINRPTAYLGMIGSKRKVETVFEELRKEGVTEEDLSRVYAPIGLDIGARTPEEIAVSIAAQIILANRRSRGEGLDPNWLEKVAIAPLPAVVVTVVRTAGSTPRAAGARMLVLNKGDTVGTIGGGVAEALARREALEVAREGTPKLLELDLTGEQAECQGMICGGRMWVYLEPLD
ncbi:MAG: XdhC family protein [Moorellales bacterium]